jgi:hypothetical protein
MEFAITIWDVMMMKDKGRRKRFYTAEGILGFFEPDKRKITIFSVLLLIQIVALFSLFACRGFSLPIEAGQEHCGMLSVFLLGLTFFLFYLPAISASYINGIVGINVHVLTTVIFLILCYLAACVISRINGGKK